MMLKEIIQLFGFLVLTFLGIVAPFLLILLSVSRDEIKQLTIQYNNERKQNEENLRKLTTKEKDINYELIEKNIKILKINNKRVRKKISSLNVKNQALRIYISLIASFLFVILALIFINDNIIGNIVFLIIAIFISVSVFFYSLIILWVMFCNVIEVRKLIDNNKSEHENKSIELLAEIKANRD